MGLLHAKDIIFFKLLVKATSIVHQFIRQIKHQHCIIHGRLFTKGDPSAIKFLKTEDLKKTPPQGVRASQLLVN